MSNEESFTFDNDPSLQEVLLNIELSSPIYPSVPEPISASYQASTAIHEDLLNIEQASPIDLTVHKPPLMPISASPQASSAIQQTEEPSSAISIKVNMNYIDLLKSF